MKAKVTMSLLFVGGTVWDDGGVFWYIIGLSSMNQTNASLKLPGSCRVIILSLEAVKFSKELGIHLHNRS